MITLVKLNIICLLLYRKELDHTSYSHSESGSIEFARKL